MASSETGERLIAADRAVGVRPWTIGAFDPVGTRATPKSVRVTAEHLPTADEVDDIAKQAHREGYQTGLAEARAGNDELARTLDGMTKAIGRLERDMASSLLTLSIDLARQVLRQSIAVRPELILPLVEEALAGIARATQPGALHLNPADLPLVEERIGELLAHAGWKPFADESVERGGCRVKFDGGDVDATMGSRWDRVVGQLDRDDAWLV
jgi:flagellar assembly protein FliH